MGSCFEWGPGPLGDAVRASDAGRLRRFIKDGESEAVTLFSPTARTVSDAGDWYGEHVGKWLIAACRAWSRTQEAELREAIERVVRHLIDSQEENGYLGTYDIGATCRFTHPEASGTRTWDLWVHAWAILGLLEAARTLDHKEALTAATRAGDLILATFPRIHASVLDLGNHAGLSSSILLEPLAELTAATGDDRYVGLAVATLEEMERRGLYVLSAHTRDLDVAALGTGKAYQICWTLVGMVAVCRVLDDDRFLKPVLALWENIAQEHLTPLGGPWGGIAGHKEVFNARGFFSPYGMVETCSAASWMSLCRALFDASGEEKYVAAYERTLLNTILGAADANGQDWCYFTFPNGRRNNTYHWACCKSSGAMALEEAASMVVASNADALRINLLTSCRVQACGLALNLVRERDGFMVTVEKASSDGIDLEIRLPEWAELQGAVLNGEDQRPLVEEGYLRFSRRWEEGDQIELRLDCPVRVHPKTFTVDHHGQEIVRMDYACVSKGPYVYATGPFDGFRKEETLRLAKLNPDAPFRDAGDGDLDLYLPGRERIRFQPYFEAGGRHEGAWRTTWLQVAWQ
jgi:DUF1680 family protein